MSEVVITERIFRFVCDWFGVTKEEILSRCRRRVLVDARTVWCYAMRRHTKMSLQEIGRGINRSHADVIHHLVKGSDWKREKMLTPNCHDAIAQVASTFSL
jgi:chromosomal replication initiation ATPase DnaA